MKLRLLQLLGRWYVALAGSLVLAVALLEALFEERDGPAQLAAQLVVVWGPLLLVWTLPALARRWRQVALLLASSALCAVAVWLTGPLVMKQVALPQYNHDIDHRPRPSPGLFNEDGIQPDLPVSSVRAEDFNIIFLGDSFTMGATVRPFQTIPAQVEILLSKTRPVRSLNFGWTSSSPILQLRQLRQIGARYKPDLVVQLFDMSDFADDMDYAAKLSMRQGYVVAPTIFDYLSAGLSVALKVDDPWRWLWRSSVLGRAAAARRRERDVFTEHRRFFHASQPLHLSKPHLAATWTALQRTHAEARRLGAGYALFILPRYQQFNRAEAPLDWEKNQWPPSDRYVLEPMRFFAEKARHAPFPIHSLLPDFKRGKFPLIGPDDPHYNKRGFKLAAEAIVRHLRADRLLRSP